MPDSSRDVPSLDLSSRRTFLGWAAATTLGCAWTAAIRGQESGSSTGGLIIREREPSNLEMPFGTLKTHITPNEQFFVRNHFPQPVIDTAAWRLKVEGLVEQPLELTLQDVLKLPTRTVTATIECAGNSRVYLVPREKGVQWGLGAVGNARWTGISLGQLLKTARVKAGAVEVVLEGADQGEIRDDPKSPGRIPFARSLPLVKAEGGDVLLAHQMNGAELPPPHGYPLRAVVPGWYGMASIKWLKRIVVVDRPFQGFYQTMDYTYWERREGLATLMPITEMQVKAAIARPAYREVVPASSSYLIQGAAWAGESAVARVEVSTDGGKSWEEARLRDKPGRHTWSFWEFPWKTPAFRGAVTLMARATDARGRTQPMQRDPDRRNYMISHVLPMEVQVA